MKSDLDVYISYAHLDNLELTEGGQGWVEMFRRALQMRITQRTGHEPNVWLDDKLRGTDVIPDDVINKVRRAAAFVAIVSPRYVASEWTRKELELFVGTHATIDPSGKSRIFKVMKAPVPLDRLPSALRITLGYEFFAVDPETGRVREFDPIFGNDADRNFWLRLDDLADDLTSQLELLMEERPEAVVGGPRTPLRDRAERVLLGVSAPFAATPGSTFTARFVAYVKELEELVQRQLRELDRDVDGGSRAVLGLTPDREGQWRIGTPVTVRISGVHLRAEPPTRAFEWNGRENLLSFVVAVEPQTPACVVPLCFEAFIEGVSVAFIPLSLTIGAESGAREVGMVSQPVLSSAFASYASDDAALVALCLSALKRWDPGLDIFMDCLDLTPNEAWQGELKRVIPSKEVFLLFWSVNASESPWVAWELQQAKASKGLEWIRPMPIDDPAIAPPPDDLKHLHFGDRYLIARQAFLRRTDSAQGRSPGTEPA